MRKFSLPRTRTTIVKSLSLLRTRNRLAVLLIVIAASSAAAVTATSAANSIGASVGTLLFGSSTKNSSPLSGGQDKAGTTAPSYLSAATSIESATNATLNAGRQGHTATLLADGRVLIAGGDIGGTAEIFNPLQGTSAS
ncbi:MAG: hypothetical protein M3371_06885, partial [Acidobacteriota bacterium]|nr:hypothetical protein [Acidobacteriota bacterium]